MIVVNDVDGTMLNVVDIINKSLPPNIKKVNHFMEYNGVLYISCDFGIVQYNLNTLQFGDTYFIGDNGAQIVVSQTAIYNGKIYAATQNNGIRCADISNPNLNDYNQWVTLVGYGWAGVEAFGSNLLAITNEGNLQKIQGNSFSTLTMFTEPPLDIRSSGDYLLVTTKNHVYVYNASLIQIADINSNQISDINVQFHVQQV